MPTQPHINNLEVVPIGNVLMYDSFFVIEDNNSENVTTAKLVKLGTSISCERHRGFF